MRIIIFCSILYFVANDIKKGDVCKTLLYSYTYTKFNFKATYTNNYELVITLNPGNWNGGPTFGVNRKEGYTLWPNPSTNLVSRIEEENK
ncbi:hypothetical protein EDD71_1077 [Fonticella tunisiensis]|uniref:Uncharacterized protein n=1 Tax=Fonticella tunisiensis TaxID=1096341 RepID=A0A4R7KRN8_9CLOT|nr:hypothetical protein EDD71_1077 [Fonticella tunisiensis]